jgi:plastocyanin
MKEVEHMRMRPLASTWLLAVMITGCGGSGDGSSTAPVSNPSPPSTPGTTGGGTASAAQSASVGIRSTDPDSYGYTTNSFDPSAVTIRMGGQVSWSNGTGQQHNVTFEPQSGVPSSVSTFTSGSVSRTFPTAGDYQYQCTFHSEMTGVVHVVP